MLFPRSLLLPSGRSLLSSIMITDTMNPPYLHNNQRVHLSQTTIETVGSMLKARHIPTQLRLGYLHA